MDTETNRQGFWGRDLARGMRGARELASMQRAPRNPVGAENTLASAHYSCAGSYQARGKLWLPFAGYHYLWAYYHANRCLAMTSFPTRTPEIVDVPVAVLAKSPFRRDVQDAAEVAERTLMSSRAEDSPPHTRALLCISAGMCHEKLDEPHDARKNFNHAVALIYDIERDILNAQSEEQKLHLRRQLVRVLRECGLHRAYRMGDIAAPEDIEHGQQMLVEAHQIAHEVSPDQVAKIQREIADAEEAARKRNRVCTV